MKVLQIKDDTGEVLNEYKSLTEAGKAMGCSASSIRDACMKSHRGFRAKGYRWIALNHNNTSYYRVFFNGRIQENITAQEINDMVLDKRELLNKTKEEAYNNRPSTFKIQCNKCNNIGKLNNYTTFNSIKVEDEIIIEIKDNTIVFKCSKCNTEIILGD